MDKNKEFIKNIKSKINLNSLFSQKEIEDIKAIIPKINPLIFRNINKINKYTNKSYYSKSKLSRSDSYEEYIDKNKFIELILEKAKLVFKEENNTILTKSISFIIGEIQKCFSESKEKRKKNFSKLTNNSYSMNFENAFKLNEKNIIYRKNSPNKNPFFININSQSRGFSSLRNSKSKSKEMIPISANKRKNNNNKYKIINTTAKSPIRKNFLNFSLLDNDYKINNIKGNSIINNFITFSNINQNISNSSNSNSNANLNKGHLLSELSLSNGQIHNMSDITRFNTFNLKNIKTFKSLLSNKIKNKNKINHNNTKSQKSTKQNNTKYIYTEKNLNHHNNMLSEYELPYNFSTNNNYLNNYIKKIEKFKTENIFVNNKNYNKKSIKKANKLDLSKYKKIINNKKEKINYLLKVKYDSFIENKDFDIFEFDNNIGKENTLLSIGNYIYMKFFFSSIINEDKFNNWCKKLAEGYTRRNPYHSDLHAADVAQTCLIYIQYGQLIDITKLNKVSICTIFLSCLCHDFKHPGVNNNFLKETKNELAIRYNDLSILENMHISETFRLINQNNDCNIFLGVDSNIYKDMRKKMISCVLSTDMTFHSKHLTFMKKIIEINKNNKNKNDDNINYNQKYMDLIVHAADISNPTKPFNIYIKWAKLVLEEFFQQGDREKVLGIPCSNDRKKVKLNLAQISFIDYVVAPFISLYITLFPKLKFFHDNTISNREKLTNYFDDIKPKKIMIKNNNKSIKNYNSKKKEEKK